MSNLKNRNERFHYLGDLADYQLKQKKEYLPYECDSYSSYQNYLYKRALYGINGLPKEEINTICNKKKQRIGKVYVKGQTVINIYKQKLTNVYTNLLFEKLFPNSPLTEFFLNNSEVDTEFKNVLTFRDLNIDKDRIVSIFIENGVLPKNFHELKTNPNQLPRLKNAGKEKNM